MLQAGSLAPEFSMFDSDMERAELSDYKGKNVVLYFYPKDDTPGCTIEAIDFGDLEADFSKLNTVVLGVSRDGCASHAAFRDKHGLSVRLLADEDGKVCEKYGVWQEKEKDGAKKMGILRSTFIIDMHGILKHVLYGVDPRGHAAEVINLIKVME